MAVRWRWIWISEKNTSLLKLIELLNLRLKRLAEFLDGETGAIEFHFYNDGAVLVPGDSDWGYLDPACKITGAQIVADPPGSISIHVYTARYPTWDVWTMISAAGAVTLTAADKAQPSISGWAGTFVAGTYVKVAVVGSPSAIRKATLTLSSATELGL